MSRPHTTLGPFLPLAAIPVASIIIGCAASASKDPSFTNEATGSAWVAVVDDSSDSTAAVAVARTVVALAPESTALGAFGARGPSTLVALDRAPATDQRASLFAQCASRRLSAPGDLAGAIRRARLALDGARAHAGRIVIAAPRARLADARVIAEADVLARAGHQVELAALDGTPAEAVARAGEALGFVAGAPLELRPVSVKGGRLAFISIGPDFAATLIENVSGSHSPPATGTGVVLWSGAGLEVSRDAPAAVVAPRAPVPVVVRASAHGSQVALDARLERDDGVAAPVALREAGDGTWRGQAPAVPAGKTARILVKATFAAGDLSFSLERERPFTSSAAPPRVAPTAPAKPAPTVVRARPPRIQVSPASLDLGDAWIGAPVTAKLELAGDEARAVRVTVEPGSTKLALAKSERATVEVKLDPARPPSAVVVRAATDEGGSSETQVQLALVGHALEAPPRIDLGKLEAGAALARDVAARLRPAAKDARVSARLDGDGVTIEAAIRGDQVALEVKAAAAAAPGPRRGALVFALASGAEREVPFEVEVTAAPRPALDATPAKLELAGGWGWVEGRLGVKADGPVEVELGELAGADAKISPRRDIRASVEKDEVVVRVYLRSDLATGTYEGRLKLRTKSAEREVPIVVQVKR
jgi:hypothetical protein